MKEGSIAKIPNEFVLHKDVCAKCGDSERLCGHFGDHRDFAGPFSVVNWMNDPAYTFDVERYVTWVIAHKDSIRWFQENPDYQIDVSEFGNCMQFMRHVLHAEPQVKL